MSGHRVLSTPHVRAPFLTNDRRPVATGEAQAAAREISLALVDDHPVVLQGVSAVFSADPRYRVLATGSSADNALAIVETNQPDIIVMDLNMPGDALAAVSTIAQGPHGTKVIVFTAYSSVDSAMKVLDAGASGLVLKGATCDELFSAVASVMAGEIFIARQYASQMLLGLRSRQQKAVNQETHLNVREKQIVDRLMKAQTNREIAVSLSISEKTVKRYMTALMLKLKARNRVEVVLQAQKFAALN
jgi:two-component system, NarL family, nitrate/nitrite response regulator NarL